MNEFYKTELKIPSRLYIYIYSETLKESNRL
jgi:hypothetical protein